jgi:hypothetical protein
MMNMHEQLPFGALAVTRILPLGSEQTFTPAAAANRRTRRCLWVELPVGFPVLVLSVLRIFGGRPQRIWMPFVMQQVTRRDIKNANDGAPCRQYKISTRQPGL